ncbi:AEL250Cp [Eremothecium gossypii ATCC 10895]|uniref:AEL250Cp n=1 Tax=Eremothecium gossypii (strain ATCC 10895 / CBS 109.51 / FGSC 9923 / NRRL Y-1056) TaxID=284811 RepID=Q758L1_EREGS|nr:AEL250Cp [Eremothecium gossypii ATCC 10895]AAS52435.1 AEL250Cp [Eremothecium gossypii ATCC 10895]
MSVKFSAEEVPQVSSEISDELQQRYTNWKKNTKLLYDYLNTNSTKWPSLTCQFMPDLEVPTDKHRLLLSSFTSSQLPEDEAVYISELSTMRHVPWSSLNNFDMDEMEFKVDNQAKLPNKNLVETVRIQFPSGDCNRACYMPQNPDIIGAIASTGAVNIFDRTKHGTNRPKLLGSAASYEIQLNEPESLGDADSAEALSLAWNWQKAGIIASSYSNGLIKVWDITRYQKSQPTISNPELRILQDKAGTNDVSWMVHHSSILAACGESNTIGLLDTRAPDAFKPTKASPHTGGINALQFNYANDMLLCAADSNGGIALWDCRAFSKPLSVFNHGDSVSALQWNPNLPTIVATAGQGDGLIKIWDTSREPEDSLLFVHGGHMLGVNDIAWNYHDPWLMCSVANDNSVHVWKPAANLVQAK